MTIFDKLLVMIFGDAILKKWHQKGIDLFEADENDLNARRSVDWFLRAANHHYAPSQYKIGYLYLFGKWVNQDSQKAFEWFQKAADQGNAEALTHLGRLYEEGHGIDKNAKQAVENYHKAAEQGHCAGQYYLGLMHKWGRGVPRNHSKAADWLMKAAQQGDREAQLRVAIIYRNGQGLPEDEEKAIEWFRKAAEQGQPSAQHQIGRLYEDGRGVPQDIEKAAEWYRKSAEQGNGFAKRLLDKLQYKYDEQARNELTGYEDILHAAEEGHAASQNQLGDIFKYREDIHRAIEWYTKAASQGDLSAQKSLWELYLWGKSVFGYDVEPNTGKALVWLKKAAEQGDVESQRNLGHLYHEGQLVTQDFSEAVRWYEKAIEGGDKHCYDDLIEIYMNILFEERKRDEIIQLCLRAIEAGNRSVMWLLAQFYHQENDLAAAAEWYQKAANNCGLVFDHFTVGYMYAHSIVFEQDFKQALKWFIMATRHFNDELHTKLYHIDENDEEIPPELIKSIIVSDIIPDQNDPNNQCAIAKYIKSKAGLLNFDPAKAQKWFHKAAEQGNTEAQMILGQMYLEGDCVEKNVPEGIEWYSKAALQGHVTAMNKMGRLYFSCESIQGDFDEAIQWFQMAADRGDPESWVLLKGLLSDEEKFRQEIVEGNKQRGGIQKDETR